jgi:hypothetical protein
MIAQHHNRIAQRAGLFLDQNFPGPHKDKRVAQHLGISPNMASLLRRGQSWTIDRLDQVREIYGWSFVRFVFDAPEPDFEALRMSLRMVLDQLPPPAAPTYLWFDDAGRCLPAPAGHAEFARRRTRLSPHIAGDLRAERCRNRGWLAMEFGAAGRVTIWHHSGSVASPAARSARDWLIRNADAITSVVRRVEIDGRVGEVEHPSAADAATALDRIAEPMHRAKAPLRADRLPLDTVPDDFGRVLGAFLDSPQRVIPAAHDFGLIPRTSILTVRGSSVTNDFMGHEIEFDRSDIVGRNVLDRRESGYGAMVHARIIAAVKEPMVHFVTGEAYGCDLHYLAMVLPIGNSQVVSLSRQMDTG